MNTVNGLRFYGVLNKVGITVFTGSNNVVLSRKHHCWYSSVITYTIRETSKNYPQMYCFLHKK